MGKNKIIIIGISTVIILGITLFSIIPSINKSIETKKDNKIIAAQNKIISDKKIANDKEIAKIKIIEKAKDDAQKEKLRKLDIIATAENNKINAIADAEIKTELAKSKIEQDKDKAITVYHAQCYRFYYYNPSSKELLKNAQNNVQTLTLFEALSIGCERASAEAEIGEVNDFTSVH